MVEWFLTSIAALWISHVLSLPFLTPISHSHFSLPFLTPILTPFSPPPSPLLLLPSSFFPPPSSEHAPAEHVKVQGHVRFDEAGAGGEDVPRDGRFKGGHQAQEDARRPEDPPGDFRRRVRETHQSYISLIYLY